MPISSHASQRTSGGEGADAFLFVKTKRAGVIKGEAAAPEYADQISVREWRWGVNASSALGHTAATSRRSYTGLTVVKGIDTATTSLMAALATNDEVTEAKLSMRRAGGGQELYFVITLNGARISGVEHDFGLDGQTTETLSIVFTKVEVEYRPQRTTGQRGGSYIFNDELSKTD